MRKRKDKEKDKPVVVMTKAPIKSDMGKNVFRTIRFGQ